MKKKILILVGIPHFDYNDEKSAVRSWLFQIKSAFEEGGHEVVFADDFDGKVTKSIPQEKKSKKPIGLIKKLLKLWPWLYYSLSFKNYFSAQDEMAKKLVESFTEIDVVVEFHVVGSFVGLEIAKACKAQFSVIFDSPVDEQFVEMHGTKSIHWKRICQSEQKTLEAADKIMVYSGACEDHIRSKYDISAEVNHLPSSLNKPVDKIVKVDSSTFTIGFIGSFLSWHKLDLLIRVFARFQRKYTDSKLILLGFGQEWERIKDLIIQLNLQEYCEIPGFVLEDELVDFKSRFTIAVMPGSNWYGSPLKLFEYSRAGIPFIAPVSKTVSSIYEDEVHCLYVREEDEEASLFQALVKFYENPALREKLGKNAQEMIESKFNKENYYQRLITNLA